METNKQQQQQQQQQNIIGTSDEEMCRKCRKWSALCRVAFTFDDHYHIASTMYVRMYVYNVWYVLCMHACWYVCMYARMHLHMLDVGYVDMKVWYPVNSL